MSDRDLRARELARVQSETRAGAHPLVMRIVEGLERAADGTVAVPEASVMRLRAALAELDGLELARASLSVALLAAYLHRDRRSPDAAARVRWAAAAALEGLEASSDRGEVAKRRFRDLTGAREEARPSAQAGLRIFHLFLPARIGG